MIAIKHNDITFEANTDYYAITQWLKDNNITYEPYNKPLLSYQPDTTLILAPKGEGYITIKGIAIPDLEDYIAAKLRWL